MKNPWRSLGVLALIETLVTELVGTAVWAIFSHDLASLDRPFYDASLLERWPVGSTIVAAFTALIAIVNALFALKVGKAGYKPVALAILLLTGGFCALYFLPSLYTVAGFGTVVGFLLAAFVLKKTWRAVSWPFRKLFGRKKPAVASAPPEQPKKAPAAKR